MSESLLSLAQTARILQCSRASLYRLIRDQGLPTVRVGRLVRVDPVKLQEWIVNQEIGQ